MNIKKTTKKSNNLSNKKERELLENAKKALNLMSNGKKVPDELAKSVQILIIFNQNLVKYLARGYSRYSGVDYEDLVAAGIESLPKAIEKFDLDVKGRFATYAGHWIRQFFQSFINKVQFISQNPKSEEKRAVIFHDHRYHQDNEDANSYSIGDTLADGEEKNKEVDRRDIKIQLNKLISSLDKTSNILIRLIYCIVPYSVTDLLLVCEDDEKTSLKRKLKISKANPLSSLEDYSLDNEEIANFSLVKQKRLFFSKKRKLKEITEILSKTEGTIRKIKQEALLKLKELAEEKKLGNLLKNF